MPNLPSIADISGLLVDPNERQDRLRRRGWLLGDRRHHVWRTADGRGDLDRHQRQPAETCRRTRSP